MINLLLIFNLCFAQDLIETSRPSPSQEILENQIRQKSLTQNQKDYLSLVSQFKGIFRDEIKKRQGDIRFVTGSNATSPHVRWTNGNFWEIRLNLKSFTEQSLKGKNSFLFLMCHELGHIMTSDLENKIPSSESEADYWAANTCFPKLDKLLVVSNKNDLPKDLLNKINGECDRVFNSLRQREVCKKNIIAGYNFRVFSGETPDYNYPISIDFSQLNCPVFKGTFSPRAEQCNFNFILAAATKRPKPTCKSYLMSSTDPETFPTLKDDLEKDCHSQENSKVLENETSTAL